MAQILEFPCEEGFTYDLRLITKGTDTIVHTTSSVAGKTNDATWFRATDLADTLVGIYRVSVIDGNGFVAYHGWVDLKGEASEEHIVSNSYHLLLKLRQKKRNDGLPRYVQRVGTRPLYPAVSTY